MIWKRVHRRLHNTQVLLYLTIKLSTECYFVHCTCCRALCNCIQQLCTRLCNCIHQLYRALCNGYGGGQLLLFLALLHDLVLLLILYALFGAPSESCILMLTSCICNDTVAYNYSTISVYAIPQALRAVMYLQHTSLEASTEQLSKHSKWL